MCHHRGQGWAHKTSLASPRFIEVPVSSQESERWCICVLGASSQESERWCICVSGVSSQEKIIKTGYHNKICVQNVVISRNCFFFIIIVKIDKCSSCITTRVLGWLSCLPWVDRSSVRSPQSFFSIWISYEWQNADKLTIFNIYQNRATSLYPFFQIEFSFIFSHSI
jgi:hypothetical protein